jgi:hypothetical protein
MFRREVLGWRGSDMKRGIQLIVSALAVMLLVRPFDCFANGPRTREAMECCQKGKCAPTAKADDCCKNTVPGANHFLPSKAGGDAAAVFATTPASISLPAPASPFLGPAELLRSAPPGTLTARNLPLLI